MRILGIETSCDETAVAVVEDGRAVLGEIVASQDRLHEPYGGVVPEIACRAHLATLLPALEEALHRAGLHYRDIDGVAVTHHPGLIGALLIGLTTAKTVSWIYDLPLVAVNHLEAHVYAAALGRGEAPFPCVSLVASGGHTTIFHSRGPCEHRRLGGTQDDAAGEAFDKVAKLLGLGYPGGPAIDRVARSGDPRAVDFPRSWLGAGSLDFSFSGLKTAVLYHVCGQNGTGYPAILAANETADVAASFQEAVVDVLVGKLLLAAERCGVRRVVVGGGVAANSRLRERLHAECARRKLALVLPPLRHCLDNAAMVAGLGYHLLRAGRVSDLSLDARPTIRRCPKPASEKERRR